MSASTSMEPADQFSVFGSEGLAVPLPEFYGDLITLGHQSTEQLEEIQSAS